ncbi:MAG: LacI family transcriptional regulator [Candidatus Thermofonsia Clade 1 bacterium]|jgi:LacI family transcriptional regulator|uniref:LacI family transcriptional regulator n=1 Tax=Candidatus Thermofonsia Clade 1 bacterium TaxID=2364210 RepID=A0A2M8PC22_9CHLR|nr:MAG: LacI family transcriptional regulator [Candidatus Thermofonsia Clade 1 bacterium]RMF53503.1 MAG: LacI family transcriptional regulator [Chloroflexota bacterium]
MATIKDIAQLAGVSLATVSRVLNNTGKVSPALRAQVLAAVETLNYQPNAPARSLRRRETRLIGVLIPQLNHPFFGTLAYSIERFLFAEGFRILVCSAEEDAEREAEYTQLLVRQRVDGAIVAPTGLDLKWSAHFAHANIPIVLIDRNLPEVVASRVMVDNWQGGYQGALHLIELGHRHIGIISASRHSQAMQDRLQGALQALHDHDVAYEVYQPSAETLQQYDLGFHAALSLLAHQPTLSALFALTDVTAIGAMHAAVSQGLSIPEQLSILGFDGIELGAYLIPALTTIAQPIEQLGCKAAEILLKSIGRTQTTQEHLILPTQLLKRASTSAPMRKE